MALELPALLGLLFVVISLILIRKKIAASIRGFAARFQREERPGGSSKSGNAATVISSEDAELKCDICFDLIGDERMSECPCGKKYHFTCAEPTGFCPYCNRKFKDFITK